VKSSEVFPSKYLKAEDLEGDITVTIENVALEGLKDQAGREVDKPVAFFEEYEKGLILNKTNWAMIAKQFGDESDDWKGKKITLTVIDVDAFGEVVSAIRVKLPKGKGPKQLPAEPAMEDAW